MTADEIRRGLEWCEECYAWTSRERRVLCRVAAPPHVVAWSGQKTVIGYGEMECSRCMALEEQATTGDVA